MHANENRIENSIPQGNKLMRWMRCFVKSCKIKQALLFLKKGFLTGKQKEMNAQSFKLANSEDIAETREWIIV